MNNEMLSEACRYWELGMLVILLKKGLIDNIEYDEISKIINSDYDRKLCSKS